MSILDITLSCLGIVLTHAEPAVLAALALIAVYSRKPHRRALARTVLALLRHRDSDTTARHRAHRVALLTKRPNRRDRSTSSAVVRDPRG